MEALGLAVFIPCAFQLAGVSRTQAWLRRWSGAARAVPAAEAPRLIRNARRAQRRVANATGLGGMCLARSLALWTLLRRRGIATDLRVGYRNRDGKVEGHAWLEYQGAPVNEAAAVIQTYTVAAGLYAFDTWRLYTN